MLQDVPKEVTDFICNTQKDESDFVIGDCDDIFMTILVEQFQVIAAIDPDTLSRELAILDLTLELALMQRM